MREAPDGDVQAAVTRWQDGRTELTDPAVGDRPPRWSVVLVVAGDSAENTTALLDSWPADAADLHDHGTVAELVVALAGASRSHLETAAAHLPADARLVSCPEGTLSAGLACALDRVTGEWVVVWPGYARPEPGWLRALEVASQQAAPAERLLQPLTVSGSGMIASAGASWGAEPAAPEPYLRDWPVSDAVRAGDLRAAAPLGPVFAVRAADLRAADGLSARFDGGLAEVDLAARLAPTGPATTRVVVGSTVTGRSPRAHGFPARQATAATVLAAQHPTWVPTPSSPEPISPPPPSSAPARPALRWSVQTAAPGGDKGRRWGDWLFAQSLARSLEALGQQVAVDTRASRGRGSRRADEVVVVLRGLDRCEPVPGAVNVLWVISHPDQVTEQECSGFDLVYAASAPWARRRSTDWGLRIEPLLQCTDPDTFNPAAGEGRPPTSAVFVGNTRGGERELVLEALRSDLQPVLYGKGWESVPGAEPVAEFLEPREVAAAYASTAVVLNDHWQDMRREGFISNRVFDALACGATVVSDRVAGIEDLAPGFVQTTGPDDDWQLLHDGLSAVADPRPDERLRVATSIAAEHSFHARASTLLAAVLELAVSRERQTIRT